MHELRSTILSGEGASARLVSTKEKCRRQSGGSLTRLVIPREERRATDQRQEDRHRGIVERAVLVFRGKKSLVRIVNISGSGVMIESEIMPRIGESLRIQFDGFEALDAAVCWVKEGRIGLDLGQGAIELD